MVVCRVDVRPLAVRLTDSALASDLFPEAYHGCVDQEVDEELQLPVRWMALELLEAVDDRRAVVYEPASDVVSAKPNTQ